MNPDPGLLNTDGYVLKSNEKLLTAKFALF